MRAIQMGALFAVAQAIVSYEDDDYIQEIHFDVGKKVKLALTTTIKNDALPDWDQRLFYMQGAIVTNDWRVEGMTQEELKEENEDDDVFWEEGTEAGTVVTALFDGEILTDEIVPMQE